MSKTKEEGGREEGVSDKVQTGRVGGNQEMPQCGRGGSS